MSFYITLSKNGKNPLIQKRIEVDEEIFNKYVSMSWTNSKGYGVCSKPGDNKRKLRLHRVIFEHYSKRRVTKGMYVDHIDRNKSNCLISNLRVLTKRQSSYNISKFSNNTSGLIGITIRHLKDGTPRYEASISDNRHDIYLGRYSSELQATQVRDAKAFELRGKLAVLNYPIAA